MDKIKINNEIVLMRHAVRKARVAVVSKLIKEVKLLNGRKHGNENMIAKCKRKADKLIEEMKILKKLKDDDISKFAITNSKNLQQVLADQNVNPDTRIMIKLAFHKTLKTQVNKFRETFPDYQAYFDAEKETKVKSKKQKTGEDKRNNEESVMKNAKKLEKDSKTATLSAESNDISEVKSCEMDSDHQDDLDLDKKSNELAISKTISKDKQIKKKMEKQEAQDKTDVTSDSTEGRVVKVVSKLATVKRFNVVDNVMENLGTEEPIIDDAEEDDLQVGVTVDPFAISVNEDTHSRIPSSRSFNTINQNNDYHNSSKSHHSRQNSFTNIDNKYKHNKEFNRNGSNTNGKFARSMNKQSYNNENNRMGNSVKQQKNINNITNNEDLHPSWAARKKQQDILKQGFQGKKIVFDDN